MSRCDATMPKKVTGDMDEGLYPMRHWLWICYHFCLVRSDIFFFDIEYQNIIMFGVWYHLLSDCMWMHLYPMGSRKTDFQNLPDPFCWAIVSFLMLNYWIAMVSIGEGTLTRVIRLDVDLRKDIDTSYWKNSLAP